MLNLGKNKPWTIQAAEKFLFSRNLYLPIRVTMDFNGYLD